MAALGTRSSVIFDIDQDGDLDLVTNDFNSEPQVLVSNLAQRHSVHWLGVALAGTASNRDALGARVRVTAGGRVLTQWATPPPSRASRSCGRQAGRRS